MKKKLPRVIFFGNEQIATGVTTEAPVLKSLVEAGYDVLAVVTSSKPVKSRSQKTPEVTEIAKQQSIPLLKPDNLNLLSEEISRLGPDIGVLIAFGKIIPQDIIDLFPAGIVNLHPSLLPKHRGPTPIESVLLSGEQKTGVSIMQLGKIMDAGPVFAQSELELKGDETKQGLADKLLEIGGVMLIELMSEILSGDVVALPQDDSRATYDDLISKSDGTLDFSKSASDLEREIRAYAGWPKSRTKIASKDVVITIAKVIDHQGETGEFKIIDKHLVACCKNDSLVVERLIPAGKNEMSGQEFVRGHQLK